MEKNKGKCQKVNNDDNLQEDILLFAKMFDQLDQKDVFQFAMMFEQLDNEHKMFMLDFLRVLNGEETDVRTSVKTE